MWWCRLWPCSVRVWTLLHDSDIDIMPLQLPAELPLMTLLSSVMFALDTPLPNSSSSPLTTTFLSPCVFTLSPSHSHLFTLPKVKRKNDHTVLKYGSSLYFFFFFFTTSFSSRGSKSHGSFPIHTIGPSPLTLHKTQDQGKLVTTTVRDYDLAEVSKLVCPIDSPSPNPLLLNPRFPTAPLSLLWHRHDGRHAWLLQIHPTPLCPGSHGSQGSFRRQARLHPYP